MKKQTAKLLAVKFALANRFNHHVHHSKSLIQIFLVILKQTIDSTLVQRITLQSNDENFLFEKESRNVKKKVRIIDSRVNTQPFLDRMGID